MPDSICIETNARQETHPAQPMHDLAQDLTCKHVDISTNRIIILLAGLTV